MPTLKPAYTLAAGRCIVKDGVPFATLHGVGQYSPTDLDAFARDVVADQDALNALRVNGFDPLAAARAYPALVAALSRLVAHADLGEVDLEADERVALDGARTLLRTLGEE